MATPTRRLAALLAGITDNDQATKVTTAGIDDDAVNAAKIAANAVGTSEVADNVLTATDLAANSVGESELSVDYTTVKPHIIPGVLQPAVAGKLLNGANHSGAYGTAQTQSGGDGHSYYYTNIKGSKPIKDPRIGSHFGSQRHKFRSIQLLDQLINIKKLFSATAIVNVKKDSFFVQGHFPGNPVMPGVLIVEAFGQAAAALTAAGIDKKEYENKLVFLMSVEKARFRNPVIPDCKLELNIEAIRSHGRVWKYKGEAFVQGKKMADAQWSATIVDRK